MKYKLFVGLFLLLSLAFVSALSTASAYGYYDGYYGDYPTSSHYVQESIDSGHYSYVTRDSYNEAYGDVTNYRKVDDYSAGFYRSLYSNYNNPMDSYWHNGPYTGYTFTQYRNVGNGYDDSYQRTVYGSDYHPYYYEPRYNGQYYDHSSRAYSGCGRYYC